MRPNEFKKRPVNDKPEGKQADVLVNLYRVSRFGFEGTIYQYDVSTLVRRERESTNVQ
jgi:hypothetical protein